MVDTSPESYYPALVFDGEGDDEGVETPTLPKRLEIHRLELAQRIERHLGEGRYMGSMDNELRSILRFLEDIAPAFATELSPLLKPSDGAAVQPANTTVGYDTHSDPRIAGHTGSDMPSGSQSDSNLPSGPGSGHTDPGHQFIPMRTGG